MKMARNLDEICFTVENVNHIIGLLDCYLTSKCHTTQRLLLLSTYSFNTEHENLLSIKTLVSYLLTSTFHWIINIVLLKLLLLLFRSNLMGMRRREKSTVNFYGESIKKSRGNEIYVLWSIFIKKFLSFAEQGFFYLMLLYFILTIISLCLSFPLLHNLDNFFHKLFIIDYNLHAWESSRGFKKSHTTSSISQILQRSTTGSIRGILPELTTCDVIR